MVAAEDLKVKSSVSRRRRPLFFGCCANPATSSPDKPLEYGSSDEKGGRKGVTGEEGLVGADINTKTVLDCSLSSEEQAELSRAVNTSGSGSSEALHDEEEEEEEEGAFVPENSPVSSSEKSPLVVDSDHVVCEIEVVCKEEDGAESSGGVHGAHASLRVKVVRAECDAGDWLHSALSSPVQSYDDPRTPSLSPPSLDSSLASPSFVYDAVPTAAEQPPTVGPASFKLFSNPLADCEEAGEEGENRGVGVAGDANHHDGTVGLVRMASDAESAVKAGGPLSSYPISHNTTASSDVLAAAPVPWGANVRTVQDDDGDESSAYQSPNSLNGSSASYLENEVPLSHVRRFSTALLAGDDSGVSSPMSDVSAMSRDDSCSSLGHDLLMAYAEGDTPNLRTSPALAFATDAVRQSWEPSHQAATSPRARRPSQVPSLRLSALGISGNNSGSAQNGGVAAPMPPSISRPSGGLHGRERLLGHRLAIAAAAGSSESAPPAGTRLRAYSDDGSYHDSSENEEHANSSRRPASSNPLGDASSRINSANNSPCGSTMNSPYKSRSNFDASSGHGSPLNSPLRNRRGNSAPIGPSSPGLANGGDFLHMRLNAAVQQSRQHSLKGAAAVATSAPPCTGTQQQQSRRMARGAGSRGPTPNSAPAYGENIPPAGQEVHVVAGRPPVKLSLAGALLEAAAAEEGEGECPMAEACETPAVPGLPEVLQRAMEARLSDSGAPANDSSTTEIPDEMPEQCAASFVVHTNDAFANQSGNLLQLAEDDVESSGSIQSASQGSESGDALMLSEPTSELLAVPTQCDEPAVFGGRRVRGLQASRADPLRREFVQQPNPRSSGPSRARAGAFTMYQNNTYEDQMAAAEAEEQVGGTNRHGGVRASQALRSLSEVAKGPAPESGAALGVSGGTALQQQHDTPRQRAPDAGSPSPGDASDAMAAHCSAPIVNQGPAPVGLTPRVENMTPRTAAHGHVAATMTPRTTTALDDLLRNLSPGTAFEALRSSDERTRVAASAALYRLSQQECHKMALCRVQGGLEALADAVAELSVPAGRQAAAGALCALAAHPGCRAVLADRGGVQAFVNLTASTSPEDQVLAARGLSYLAALDPKRSHIVDAGGAYALVCLLDAGEGRVREAAARALWNLAHTDEDCRRSIADSGGIPRLLEMAQGDSPAEAAAAAGALWNLAANPRNQALIQAEGGIPVVVALFREGGNPGAQLAAAGALCNLLLRKEAHTAILAAGAAPVMVEVLECGPEACKPTVARALFVLAREAEGCAAVVAAGACQPLAVEVAGGNDMAAWALKAVSSFEEFHPAVLDSGGAQALLSLLRAPAASPFGVEAAAWAIKSLTEAPVRDVAEKSASGLSRRKAGGVKAVMANDGVAALLGVLERQGDSGVSASGAEGAARALWNLAFQDGTARAQLGGSPAALARLCAVVREGDTLELRQAGAGVLWNLASHPKTRPAALSAGVVGPLLRLMADAKSSSPAGAVAAKAVCTLSGDPRGVEVMLSTNAMELLATQAAPSGRSGVPASTVNAVLVALYNCLVASLRGSKANGSEAEEASLLPAVDALVEVVREGDSSVRGVALRALRGVVGVGAAADAAVKARIVPVLGDELAAAYANEIDFGHGTEIKPKNKVLGDDEVASALWVVEGVAFRVEGQQRILGHPPLLLVLVHLLRHGTREAQRASVRVLHNLTAGHATAAEGPLVTTPSLLPALLYVAGDQGAVPAVRESAAWSIKALTALRRHRQNLVDLYGIKVMSDLLEAPSSTHGCHQAASLVLRNLATDPDHSRAVATEGPDVIAALVGLLSQRHGHKECRAAAISALANLSACEALKAGVVAASGPTAIARCLRHKEDGAVRQAAARAAANLTYHYPAATEAMVAGGGGAALVPLLRSTDGMEVATSALAVSNMAAHPPARSALVADGAIEALLAALRDAQARRGREDEPSAPQEESCVRALWGLAPDPMAASQVAAQGGVALLLRILGRSAGCRDSRSVVRATNGALRVLTGSEANRQALMSAGAVAQLVEVLDSNPPPEAAESAALALWDLAVSGANAAAMGAAGGIPALVALLASHRPGTRHAAVGALHNLAFADGNKEAIVAAGGIEVLVSLLGERTPESCNIAANTLKILALRQDNKVLITQAGGIKALSALLRNGSATAREAAAAALRNLATNKSNKLAIVEAGALPPLVEMLQCGGADAQHAAAGALCNLAFNSALGVKEAVVAAGALPRLVALLGAAGGSPPVGELAARCVWNLASCSEANRTAIAAAGGIAALVGMAGRGAPKMQGIAAGALSHLAIDGALKDAIREAGGIPVLLDIAAKGSTAEGFQASVSVLRNLAVAPSSKAVLVQAGAIPSMLGLLRGEGPPGDAEAAKGVLRSLAFNSQSHTHLIQDAAGLETSLDELLAPCVASERG